MPTSDSTTRLLILGATTLVMMLLAWLIVPTISAWQRSQLANQLVAQVEAADDSAVKVPLRQLSDVGEAALEPLVVAASSERAAVAVIARQIINEKLTAWKLLAEASTAEIVDRGFVTSTTRLAAALAGHINEFGPAGKQWTEGLALEMIEFADTLPPAQSGSLLADCSRILAVVPPRGPRLRTVPPTAGILPTTQTQTTQAVPQPSLDPLTRASDGSLETLTRVQPSTSLEFQGRLTPVPSPVVTTTKPLPSELNWSRQQNASLEKQPTTEPATTLKGVMRSASKRPNQASSQVIDIPTPQEMQDQADTLRQFTSDELLLRLHSANFYEAGIIRVVLGERGFKAHELVLLQRLTSPMVADRLRLVEDASSLSAVAARRVLRRLLEDKSADVRLRALTALATTNAPDLTGLARELAVRDEDPRVAKLASRLLRELR